MQKSLFHLKKKGIMIQWNSTLLHYIEDKNSRHRNQKKKMKISNLVRVLVCETRIELAVTNTFVVVRTIHWVIPFNWNLLCSAFVLASSAFIVSASWSHWSYHQSSRILFHQFKKHNTIEFTNWTIKRRVVEYVLISISYLVVVHRTLINPLRMRN